MATLEDRSLESRNSKKNRKLNNRYNFILIETYTRTRNGAIYVVHMESEDNDKDEPPVTYVPSSQLPENVLGMYDPVGRAITVSSQLDSRKTAFVERHEKGHDIVSRHFDNPPGDEYKADAYATAKTGYVLRPFGISEDDFRVNYTLEKYVNRTANSGYSI